MKAITVYCGSADSIHPDYLLAAKQMGATLAQRGLTLVYGGGKTGLMGAVADGALAAGGRVIGVITEAMNTPALAHARLTRLEAISTIHERKARLYELGDGFIALPGGFGTFDELFETITWAQIGLHEKPIGLFNPRGYYDFLMRAIAHAEAEGFIFPEHRQMLCVSADADALLDAMARHEHPRAAVKRWMREE
jgi:hypothetical protein